MKEKLTRGKSESLITPQSAVLLLLEGLLFTQNFMGCLQPFNDNSATIMSVLTLLTIRRES